MASPQIDGGFSKADLGLKFPLSSLMDLRNFTYLCRPTREVAQLVEHDLAKVGVASSNLVFPLKKLPARYACRFFYALKLKKAFEHKKTGLLRPVFQC